MSEPVSISFVLVTGGADPEIDFIGVCLQSFKQLTPEAQRRALCYLWERSVGPCRLVHSAGEKHGA